jgi:hypothetical protein
VRRLLLLAVLASGVAVFAVTAVCQASTFVPEESFSHIGLGANAGSAAPVAALSGTEGMVTLSDNGLGGHVIQMSSNVWTAVNYGGGTSVYTGVPLVSNIWVTVRNAAGTFESDFSFTNFVGDGSVLGPRFGGERPMVGRIMVTILKGVFELSFDAGVVGGPAGGRTTQTALGNPITITGGPWATGPIPVTNITTNVISVDGAVGVAVTLLPGTQTVRHTLSTGGGYVSVSGGLPLEAHTVTLQGTNQLLSAGQDGTVTLVAPMRVNSSPAVTGRQPGTGRLWITFVPEPGTLLLLVAGAVGLTVAGHRRMRR